MHGKKLLDGKPYPFYSSSKFTKDPWLHALKALSFLHFSCSSLSKSLTLLSGGILEWNKWKDTLSNWISWLNHVEDDRGECPATEVLKYVDQEGYFASSPDPHTPRPRHVKFRVGQVIRHKLWNYRGIIVGWDNKLKVE